MINQTHYMNTPDFALFLEYLPLFFDLNVDEQWK